MMEVSLKKTINIRPPSHCQQRRLALRKGISEPVLLALSDDRRISHRSLLGARQTILDAARQPQLGDAPRQHQLGDAPRQLQLQDADSDSETPPAKEDPRDLDSDGEKPPVKEDPRDSDFRSPELKANLKAKTPIWDKFIENLSRVTSNAHVREFIEFLRTECFTKPELLWMNANGDRLPFPLPFALKMEQLFDAAKDQRMRGLKKLKTKNAWSDSLTHLDETYEFSEDEMKELWQLRLLSDVF